MTIRTTKPVNYNLADPAYVDLDVYVVEESGREFNFRVTLNREDGTIFDSPTRMAESEKSDFGDEIESADVPESVRAAFAEVRPSMVEELEKIREANPTVDF